MRSERAMDDRERFRYKDLAELVAHVEELGLAQAIGFSEDLSPLRRQVTVGPFRTPNALATHPMEGHDAQPDGSPSHLTRRRYERLARGGAGLIWVEAVAVRGDWRAHPRQLWLSDENRAAFAQLREQIVQWHRQEWTTEPLIVLQLTHAGRFTRPGAARQPHIGSHRPGLDEVVGVDDTYPLVTDGELEEVQEAFVRAGRWALEAGYAYVDVKSCHGYLSSELLSAFTRPGPYGGSYENRSRFLRVTLQRMKAELGADLHLAVRLNAYDGLDHPYGWGADRDRPGQADPSEPSVLARSLVEWGVELINVTAGIPYWNPWVGRPFDRPVEGKPGAPEHPLEGVGRLFRLAEAVRRAVPQTPVVGTGYSWLRQFLGQAAAYNIAQGRVSLVGAGRMAFAYPDFARDLLSEGKLDRRQVCAACSRCSELMIRGGPVGCVVRDREVYGQHPGKGLATSQPGGVPA